MKRNHIIALSAFFIIIFITIAGIYFIKTDTPTDTQTSQLILTDVEFYNESGRPSFFTFQVSNNGADTRILVELKFTDWINQYIDESHLTVDLLHGNNTFTMKNWVGTGYVEGYKLVFKNLNDSLLSMWKIAPIEKFR